MPVMSFKNNFYDFADITLLSDGDNNFKYKSIIIIFCNIKLLNP